MIINGKGYVCKSCRVELMSDDVTYFASNSNAVPKPITNCCKAKVVKKNWVDKFKERLWKRLNY